MEKTIVNLVRGSHGMGVTILIQYQQSRVILDFGAPFTPLTKVFDGTVWARENHYLTDELKLQRALPVDGIYPEEKIKDTDIQPYLKGQYQQAVFISHCHLDHMSEADQIHPDIPVYFHTLGYKLKKALEEIEEERTVRDYSTFEYGDEIQVGEIKVIPHFSDHCCAGAAGFYIETPDKKIIYSGDLRFHGCESERAWKIAESFSDIDALFVDCSTTSPNEFIDDPQKYRSPSKENMPNCITEQDIYDDVEKKLSTLKGIGFFNLYHRDLRMMNKMIEIADKTERTCVFLPDTAYILNKLTGKKVPIALPDHPYKAQKLQQFIKESEIVEHHELVAHPEKYFLENSYPEIMEVLDYQNGYYFHLFGEPLTKEESHYKVMEAILKERNIQLFSYLNLYSFSHCYPNHLAEYIRLINARNVISVHSRKPENVNPVNSKQQFIRENTNYIIQDDQFIEIK